jgi:hypothetical protein
MKFIRFFIFINVIIITISCATKVKDDDLLEQSYPYSSALYYEYNNDEESGKIGAFGEVIFTKSKITLLYNTDDETDQETFNIKTVTYEEDPQRLRYRTNKGDFIIKVKNDTIKEVGHYTSKFSTIFYR